VQKQNTEHALTEADTERSLQLALDQGHGTPMESSNADQPVCIRCSAIPAVEM